MHPFLHFTTTVLHKAKKKTTAEAENNKNVKTNSPKKKTSTEEKVPAKPIPQNLAVTTKLKKTIKTKACHHANSAALSELSFFLALASISSTLS